MPMRNVTGIMVRKEQKERFMKLAKHRKTTQMQLIDDLLTMATMPEAKVLNLLQEGLRKGVK